MPENLKPEEVNSQTDPSVAKQYDNETSKVKQVEDFYKLVDENKISMLNAYRKGVGPVGRCMAVAKRSGPDILYLTNAHSKKMDDLQQNKEVQISFHDTKTEDWISITGVVTTLSNSDPRIEELYTRAIKAWFGDLGDGKHDGGPRDPRMTLIEIKSKYVVYYKTEVGTLGMITEVGAAALTGKVAKTGTLRELTEQDLEQARKMG
ncbi:hypothetical protein DM02DRAFT_684490 [Periconia macrospinosa]|uniref:General stress protein FMN-binding split barrel domain-containing protein n=1 Tax=Periconia macrospinosa TaxID=97972 RepID=A0A2V1DHV4_9PLEO|nr:hypothetical protein DM02DRAFT_684490 [Periconia macrospinosa]